jgi:hypothetical protein
LIRRSRNLASHFETSSGARLLSRLFRAGCPYQSSSGHALLKGGAVIGPYLWYGSCTVDTQPHFAQQDEGEPATSLGVSGACSGLVVSVRSLKHSSPSDA